MIFRKATFGDGEAVCALYQAAKGEPLCAWNEAYPGWAEINHDLETENLYVLTQGDAIIGAVSIVPENELDDFSCWRCRDSREIARVVIGKNYQGRGLAGEMVAQLLAQLKGAGCQAVHLSVVKHNSPALKTYQKLGFETVGEAELYGNRYYLMEKYLGE